MNLEELEDEVRVLVNSSTDSLLAKIPSLINEAVLYVANEPGVILPSLKTIQVVQTTVGQSYTTMTTGFNGKIIFASVAGVKISHDKLLDELVSEYNSLQDYGSVKAVALEDQTLWYADQPEEATNIFMLLYANPPLLSAPTDIPTCIPSHLHRVTILPRCAQLLFEIEEQDELEVNVSAKSQELIYKNGITKLREYLAARRRGMSNSIWNV